MSPHTDSRIRDKPLYGEYIAHRKGVRGRASHRLRVRSPRGDLRGHFLQSWHPVVPDGSYLGVGVGATMGLSSDSRIFSLRSNGSGR